MPDLSPSLTLLLQLPHLDEEVEALVITTGNYLISLSQQLGCNHHNLGRNAIQPCTRAVGEGHESLVDEKGGRE